jgi:hypothetical protein
VAIHTIQGRNVHTDKCSCLGWTATFDDYDGAPDAHDSIGLGMTEQQAIDSLFEIEELKEDRP